MKILFNWLNDYVDLSDLTPEQVSERLTFSGIEVEGLTPVGHDYAGLVVGEVRAVRPHPNADRLRLCRVFDGSVEYDVVCGAHNFEVGDKGAFAGLDARLPGGTRLRKAKIRGEVSHGMLLAEDELDLSDDHAGIVLFDRAVAAGTPLAELLPGPDVVFDLEITWNRPDCLSVIGIAREMAALLRRPLRLPDVSLDEQAQGADTRVSVAIEDPQGCPRYTARVLEGVGNDAAPLWLRQRLRHCGVRTLGALVDVTNYVMLECGQPLHAFDLETVGGRRIIVRRARPGETLKTLDGETRRLTDEMLVIADADRAVALAGVMGGGATEVGQSTRAILLESANFDAPLIKHTAYRLGMQTESAHRFERGVDPGLADWASRRAAGLMHSIVGGTVLRGVVDAWPAPPAQRTVTMRFERARTLTGMPLSADEMVEALTALELECRSRDAQSCEMRIPGFRPDLEIEADLIEEVARLHGLDAVPAATPAAPVISDIDDQRMRDTQRCREHLLGLGFTEAMHYSFTSLALLDAWDPRQPERRVVLPNPVSTDYAVMRPSLLPQLVDSLGRNHARQVPALALFEIGRVFDCRPDGQTREAGHVSLGLYGPVGRDPLDQRRAVATEEAFFWLKGAIEAFCAALRFGTPTFSAADPHPALCPGSAAQIRIGERAVGRIGRVVPRLLHRYRMHCPMIVAEIALDRLLESPREAPALKPPPAFPSVMRDIALIAGAGVTHARILDILRGAAPKELTTIALFDSFNSHEVGAGKRCLGYSLEYRSDTRTLTDEAVNHMHLKVVSALRSEPEIEIRDR